MLRHILLGGGFAFGATIQPGPLQAFLLSRVATAGWRRTLPACASPLLSDGPIALLVLLVLGQLSPAFQRILRGGGGLLLLYFAWVALRRWRDPAQRPSPVSAPHTLLQAALVNVLNPNPYLGWALVLGPAALDAWRERPIDAVALVVSFYGAMVGMLALFILLAGSARLLGRGGQSALVALSTLILAILGIWLLIEAILGLGPAGPAAPGAG